MGSGMAKYSSNDTYYKKRRGTRDVDTFSKEYWKGTSKKDEKDSFNVGRNEFGFSNNVGYDSPLRDKRKKTSFVSSFSPPSTTSTSSTGTTSSSASTGRYK